MNYDKLFKIAAKFEAKVLDLTERLKNKNRPVDKKPVSEKPVGASLSELVKHMRGRETLDPQMHDLLDEYASILEQKKEKERALREMIREKARNKIKQREEEFNVKPHDDPYDDDELV